MILIAVLGTIVVILLVAITLLLKRSPRSNPPPQEMMSLRSAQEPDVATGSLELAPGSLEAAPGSLRVVPGNLAPPSVADNYGEPVYERLQASPSPDTSNVDTQDPVGYVEMERRY